MHTAANTPRAYSLVRALESRVAELEAQLAAARNNSTNASLTAGAEISCATLAFGVPERRSYLRSNVSPALFFRQSCPPLAVVREQEEAGLSPTVLPRAAPQQPASSKAQPLSVMDLRSVPLSALERMVRNYVDVHWPQYPCVSEVFIRNLTARVRGLTMASDGQDASSPSSSSLATSDLTHFEHCVFFLVLAISAMTLQFKGEDQARTASESFITSGIRHLYALKQHSDVEALQISLLLAHYAHLCPERADNWAAIASAVRIVLDLGLHKGSPEAIVGEERRRRCQLFWVTYGMERSLCANLRLPLSFTEESMTTPVDFPNINEQHSNPDDLERKSSANHIYFYRQLETEAHRVLHLQEDLQLLGHVDIQSWLNDICARLNIWYEKAQAYTQYSMLEFQAVQFNHLRLRLHRPAPRMRTRTIADQGVVLDASRALIEDYSRQEQRRRLFYPWHGVHILFEAAIMSIEACWGLRSNHGLANEVQQMLHVSLPQCLRLLTNIGQRWEASKACADRLAPLLDKIASAVQAPTMTDLDAENAIMREIEGLLFSDGPLTWDQTNLADFPLGSMNVFGEHDDVLFDASEFLQWDTDWGLTMEDSSLL